MAWAKIDDSWWSHPKVKNTPLSARGLWITAASWAAAYDTHLVPGPFLAMSGASKADADALVANGLWTEREDGWAFVPGAAVTLRRRQPIHPEIRRLVYERDGGACLHCGTTDDLTLDHVIPWSEGGPDTYPNLQTLCRPCNSRKGASL